MHREWKVKGKKPHQLMLLARIKKRRPLNGKVARRLSTKYNLSPSGIWMTYERLRKQYPKYIPPVDPLGRKRIDPIMAHRPKLRRLILSQKGNRYIRLPSTKLSSQWGFTTPTIASEARRILAQLNAKATN